MNLLEKNTRVNLLGLGLGSDFSKPQAIKKKNRLDFIKIKNYLAENEMMVHRMEENICKSHFS